MNLNNLPPINNLFLFFLKKVENGYKVKNNSIIKKKECRKTIRYKMKIKGQKLKGKKEQVIRNLYTHI